MVASKGEIREMWVELEDADTGRALLSLSWLETTKDSSLLDRAASKEDAGLSRAVLHVFVDSCEELHVSKSSQAKPSPMVSGQNGN